MPPTPLHPDLHRALLQYRSTRNFNAAQWVHDKAVKLNQYMQRCHLSACVTNVSGGVDSAVVIALCGYAMQQCANSSIKKNVGVCQPINSSAWALQRGRENISSCGATQVIVDQTSLHQQLATRIEGATKIAGKDFARGQLRSYMRAPAVYYVAQLLSQEGNAAIVMGTGNKDQDYYLGYFCKAGDGVVDVSLISDLHKSEVFAVAKYLSVPQKTCCAPPSADLWDGQTDEDELGFPYDFVELFTGWYMHLTETAKLLFVNSLSIEAQEQFAKYTKACELVHRRNAHKLCGPVSL